MTQNDIANLIMNQFVETNSKPKHVIQERWINQVLLRQLNAKEQNLINPAINDLVNDGLIKTDDRSGFCLVLTEKGFDAIYPINEDEVIERIGSIIMQQFADTNSKVNHVVDYRWINFNLSKWLNPKENALIERAIERLVENDLITTEDRHVFCMVLTQKGFDSF